MTRNIDTILGVPITSTSIGLVLGKILNFEASLGTDNFKQENLGKMTIFTPNPEFLVEASKNPEFKELLNRSDINLPDGFGLLVAAKILNIPIGRRISGADLVEKLMQEGNQRKWTVGIAGARRGEEKEVEELIKRLSVKYSGIKIINLDSSSYCVLRIALVLACHGMVKQEKWIVENKDKINGKVFIGVGGSLDFLAGYTKRAPGFMRGIGLEWLWRGLQRPRHFKRIWKATVIFPLLVVKEKLGLLAC